MITMQELWSLFGTATATIMFFKVIVQDYVPSQFKMYLDKYWSKLVSLFYPYVQITFQEYTGNWFKRSEAYTSIQSYLGVKSSSKAKRLKASDIKNNKSLVLSIDYNEEVVDEFNGVKIWWRFYKIDPRAMTMSFIPNTDEKRHYQLTFHRRHKDLVVNTYLPHIVNEGKRFAVMNRQRKLYTNGTTEHWSGEGRTRWSHVLFSHPATFDTLAMEPKKKREILNDLEKFKGGKEYYKKVGKAWKRGYLLYGPPGTGKSTMISAMANFLDYDVYDLELTAVKDNTELKKLLIDTSNKCIIVIEDIDCSLDLTGQRSKKKKEKDEEEKKKDEDEKKDPVRKKMEEMEDSKTSKVTLSGLLNFIDGIWSACGEERVIVFTTNHVDKLDPALIRRGRMDKHIELSYCSFEAFKVLARNYLDVEHHETFGEIERLLGETEMTPADVAENLMPKSDEEDEETCLKNLVEVLEKAKEDAEAEKKKKAEEEARLKAEEEEAKAKAEKEEKKSEEESEKKISGKEGVKCNGKLNGDDGEKEVKENGTVTTN